MRRIVNILSVIMAAVPLFSCGKEARVDPEPVPIRLVVDVSGPGTRATGVTSNDPSTEAKVNSLQVLVFNGEALDGYGSSSNSLVATVSCTAGEREIYAVVNASDLSGVSSKAGLLATVSSLANEISNFQMIGSTTGTLQADGSVAITVDRLAARVVLRGIRNGLNNAAQAADFTVQSVYLTNVTGDVDFGRSADYTVSRWYNRRGYEASNNLGDFTYDAVGTKVDAGATDATAHYFYTMPNGYPGQVGLPQGSSRFTPRAERLVIRVSVAGTVYDYPILLPSLESNKSYEITLVDITRLGNPDDGSHDPDDPDDTDEERPVSGFEQAFEITVNDWTVVLVGDNGNVQI